MDDIADLEAKLAALGVSLSGDSGGFGGVAAEPEPPSVQVLQAKVAELEDLVETHKAKRDFFEARLLRLVDAVQEERALQKQSFDDLRMELEESRGRQEQLEANLVRAVEIAKTERARADEVQRTAGRASLALSAAPPPPPRSEDGSDDAPASPATQLQLVELQGALDEAQVRVQELEEELGETLARTEEVEITLVETQERLEAAELRAAEVDAELRATKQAALENASATHHTSEEVEEAVARATAAVEARDAAVSRAERVAGEVAQLRTKLEALKAAEAEQQVEFDAFAESVMAENQGLKEQVKGLEAEVQRAAAAGGGDGGGGGPNSEEVGALKVEVLELQKQLNDWRETGERNGRLVAEHEFNLARLKEMVSTLTSEREATLQSMEAVETRADQYKAEVEELHRKLVALKTDALEVQGSPEQVAMLQDKLVRAERQAEEQERRAVNLERQLNQARLAGPAIARPAGAGRQAPPTGDLDDTLNMLENLELEDRGSVALPAAVAAPPPPPPPMPALKVIDSSQLRIQKRQSNSLTKAMRQKQHAGPDMMGIGVLAAKVAQQRKMRMATKASEPSYRRSVRLDNLLDELGEFAGM